jgi:hypothetical protein
MGVMAFSRTREISNVGGSALVRDSCRTTAGPRGVYVVEFLLRKRYIRRGKPDKLSEKDFHPGRSVWLGTRPPVFCGHFTRECTPCCRGPSAPPILVGPHGSRVHHVPCKYRTDKEISHGGVSQGSKNVAGRK